jgi:alkanesulfonate monooxygenase SsuD/methylene tetrahydromethanopterin reductase-like flavin-dependent oxidoreductase (luciferase family)
MTVTTLRFNQAAAAVFGATRRIGVIVCALLTPLYEPLRLAEDVAVLDHLSGGRLTLVAGLGYRPEEYAALGRDWERRGRLQDEVLETLLRAALGVPGTDGAGHPAAAEPSAPRG